MPDENSDGTARISMPPADLYKRYQELQRYAEWTDYDVSLVRLAASAVEQKLDRVVTDFYAQIEKHQKTRIIITGGRDQVKRLKQSLRAWIRELLTARYDAEYVAHRWRIGRQHVEIGLDRMYVAAAFSRLRGSIIAAVEDSWEGDSTKLVQVVQAVDKLLDLDLAIIEMAYQSEFLSRQRDSGALHESEERIRAIVNTAVDAIVTIDLKGVIQTFNPAAERMFGYTSDEAIGRNVAILMPAPHRDEHANYISNYLTTGQAKIIGVGREASAQRRDGQVFPVELAVSEIDHMGLFVGIIRDVSDRKRIEQKLVQSERLAAIGEMIAGLAHESRNAFQRSQSCLEMLELEVEAQPEALDLVHRIQKALDHLHHLYEEVRDYAAPMNLRREKCDAAQAARDTWGHLELARKAKDIRLIEEIRGGTDCQADPYAIEQVLRNVLENAVWASREPGEIHITFQDALINGQAALQISVMDDGPGIATEVRDRVFDPFYTTKTKGTGLGMAIARRIVEAHGGEIVIGDRHGGAEIVITLPK